MVIVGCSSRRGDLLRCRANDSIYHPLSFWYRPIPDPLRDVRNRGYVFGHRRTGIRGIGFQGVSLVTRGFGECSIPVEGDTPVPTLVRP